MKSSVLEYAMKNPNALWEGIAKTKIGTASKCVYYTIAVQSDDFHPSISNLMRKLSISRPTVIKALQELQYYGFLVLQKVDIKRRNNYNVIAPDMLTSQETLPLDSKESLPSKLAGSKDPLLTDGKESLPCDGKESLLRTKINNPIKQPIKDKGKSKTKRTTVWDAHNRFTNCLDILSSLPCYATIFDVPKEVAQFDRYLERGKPYGLDVRDLEELLTDFTDWVQINSGKVKRPRGVLNTFMSHQRRDVENGRYKPHSKRSGTGVKKSDISKIFCGE